MTPAVFSVCQARVNDWPGLMDTGCALNATMRASKSLALPYAEPSKPAGTAPGAFGAACPAGWAGACARAGAQENAAIKTMAAKTKIAFIRTSFLGLHHSAVAQFHIRADH